MAASEAEAKHIAVLEDRIAQLRALITRLGFDVATGDFTRADGSKGYWYLQPTRCRPLLKAACDAMDHEFGDMLDPGQYDGGESGE